MKIVYVDGFKIRNTLDDDFADVHWNTGRFSDFSSKFYIPEGETWIDHIFKKSGETDFLLKVDEEYYRYLLNKNLSGGENWRSYLDKKMLSSGPIPDFIIKKENINDLKVVYVDGALIRRFLDCQFFYGGHDLVYSYIPKNEIWLDIINDPAENKYFLVHEKTERELMAQGKKYDVAHRIALAADMDARAEDGLGIYPGDENYPWTGLSNEEIIKKYYVINYE